MTAALKDLRIGFIERRHPPGHEGAVADQVVPLLRTHGARVDVVHAEEGVHRLDHMPPWDMVVLKSGAAAALHLAAAAEAYGIPSLNSSEATRLVQDKPASVTILRRAGLPVPRSCLAWFGETRPCGSTTIRAGRWTSADGRRLDELAGGAWVIKAARSSQGQGLWTAAAGELPAIAETLPDGPYLLMERIAHTGDDLKVYAAGDWMTSIERPFPATTLTAKQGRSVPTPAEVAIVVRETGRLLGVSCYGCDFVHGAGGWTLVDINAFPGYKGAPGATEALAAEVARKAGGRCTS